MLSAGFMVATLLVCICMAAFLFRSFVSVSSQSLMPRHPPYPTRTHIFTDALKVPIGLISSSWGGTIIQSWSDNSTNALCAEEGSSPASTPAADAPRDAEAYVAPGFEAAVGAGPNPNTGYGVLFNAMINPFAVGPMAVSSFIWFQGAFHAVSLTLRPRANDPRRLSLTLRPTSPQVRATTAT